MDLLPADLARTLPALYTQEGVADPLVRAKFFTPDSSWTWYAVEFEASGHASFADAPERFRAAVAGFPAGRVALDGRLLSTGRVTPPGASPGATRWPG